MLYEVITIENLSQDYIRTAFSKGLSEKRVIFKHALRNSLIPIATGLGHFLSFLIAGSFLIELVFNINGMGLLGFRSIESRDYPVTMGILVISSFFVITSYSIHYTKLYENLPVSNYTSRSR